MNKKSNIIYSILVFLFAFSFNSGVVKAYFTDKPEEKVNTFTIAELKEVTYVYSYIDENDNKHTLKDSETEKYFIGSTITLADKIDNTIDYDQVKIYVDNNEYTSNSYVVNDDTTVEYVYYLNRYTITYNLDGGTLNNPINTYTIMTPTFDLPTPTKTDATFDGWCIGNNCSNPYTIMQGSTGNISVTAKWKTKQIFTVTYTGDTGNYTYTGATTVVEGSTYTSVITAKGSTFGQNNYISDVIVTMGGDDVQNAWNANTRTVTVTNVSGNITIEVTSRCLIEGTKIMLWDGSTKNVEDITYNDLLLVWNHETGTYGYEYPAWIEKAGKVSQYTKVTFSDGTELKIASDHRLFSKRLNKYVNINSGELHIGDEVVSLKDGVDYVSIVNIETVNEEANYYHVITTRYFNMIAEGLLTTYEINDEISSNYKGFDNNMKWVNYTPEDKKMSYEEVLNTFGYVDKYLYKAMKIEDFGYAIEQGYITQEALTSIINTYMRQDGYKVIPPKNSYGQYLWMVTTSDMDDPSNSIHQIVDGSEYEIPTPENEEGFKYWYNHSDNKYYNPGDVIVVDSSMYLEAIYE